jgi:hypothetical protein
MRKAAVYLRGEYVFRYDDTYFANPGKPAIRMSRPKH